MTTKLLKILVSLILLILTFILKFNSHRISNILLITSYAIVGYDIVLKALRNIKKGSVFDENFLMIIATFGAFFIGEYHEAVAVMLFYQIGELFQSYAIDKSRKSIANLMEIRPDYANVYREENITKVDPDEVEVGEIILVKPGEKIPLDGVVVEGNSRLNTSALTGESHPQKVTIQDEVLSGCINNEAILKVKVTKKFEESTVSKILDLVENASNKKSSSENFITKFARIYTPIVVLIALLLAVIPPIILESATFNDWFYRALSFLVVSCPCALVISIPLTFFGGIGAASKIGVLIKGSNYLEALSKVEIVVCDKTGTLTEGNFQVQKIESENYEEKELLKYAAHAECYSNHPISLSLKEAYKEEINEKLVTETKEIPGKGVKSLVEGKTILVGNEKWLKENNIKFKKRKEMGTPIYVAINSTFVGTIVIADQIKENAKELIQTLKKKNVQKIVMLTGDKENMSAEVSQKLKLEEYHAELLPQDKVAWVEKLMTEKSSKGSLLFIGDGINDAPVLALADIGVAMGALGSDAAIEAADIVLMTDELYKIVETITISQKTMHIVKQNILFAISLKIAILILSALGLSSMWMAVFADVGVSFLAILNALRILHTKKEKK